MKIVFYISNLETKGGAERALIGLANWFARTNDVVIVSERGKRNNSAYQINENVTYYSLEDYNVNFPISRISLLISIRKLLKKINPDIIISFLALANTRLLKSGIYKKYPVVVCERNDPRSDPNSLYRRYQRDKAYKKADRIIVQTDEVKEYFTNLGYSCVDVIPNFVNTIPYIKVDKENCFVSMGRLSEQKNQKWLIEAFIKSDLHKRGFKLAIYGNGKLKNELNEYIKNNSAEHYVTIHDAIPNILEVINKAYCFVLPSLFEGMPNALMEAMSMGLPCISTDCPCGGPRSLIKSGYNGILVELGNQEMLIAAMNKIAEDNELACLLGENAFKIRDTHSLESLQQLWMNAFINTINGKKKHGEIVK